MALLDIFARDAFSLRSMTAAINKIPLQPNYLGTQEGLFNEVGSSTITVMIEELEGRLSLIPNSGRGTQGNALPPEKRKARAFICNHKQVNDQILADQVLGVRMFGSETQMETVAQKVAERLKLAADSMEATLEYMRVGAVQGKILDADGSVITNLFDEFGVAPRTDTWKFKGDNKMAIGDIKRKCNEIRRQTVHALGGTTVTGIDLLCGNDFFDAVETSPEIIEIMKYPWPNRTDLLVESQVYRYFEYCGIRFVNYLGYIGDKEFIDPKKAYVMPRGVPGLFMINYGPADYSETVNTAGIKYYAKQERMPFDKGIEIECQTNPLVLCTRPGALCEITLA